MTGKVIGDLTVLTLDKVIKSGNGYEAWWKCRCRCAKVVSIRGASLRSPKHPTLSCGCLRLKKVTKHGQFQTREWQSWKHAKARCLNPRHKNFHYYGGRGITICEEWKNSFQIFLRDMGPCPKGKSLDRFPNNDGNYEPENCRWATASQQRKNQRPSIQRHAVNITFQGETLNIAQWARRLGINKGTLHNRLRKYHWPIERALTKH